MTTDPGFETGFIRGVRRVLHSPLVFTSSLLSLAAAACLFAGGTVYAAFFVPAACFTVNAVLLFCIFASSGDNGRPFGTAALKWLLVFTLVELVGGAALFADYILLKYFRIGISLPIFENGGLIPVDLPFDAVVGSILFSFFGAVAVLIGILLPIFIGGLIKSIREGAPRARGAMPLFILSLIAAVSAAALGVAVFLFPREGSWIFSFWGPAGYAASALFALFAAILVIIALIFPRYRAAARHAEDF